MSMGAILGIAIVTAMAGGILRQYNPTLAIWVSLTGGGILLLGCIGQVQAIAKTMERLLATTNIESSFLFLLLKALGISYLCQFASDLCHDVGETALAGYVILAGKIIMVGLSYPMVEQVIKMIVKLIDL